MSATRNNKPIPILMYHSIASPPQDEVMRSIHVKPNNFAIQMWLLKKLGYKGLSMSDLAPYLTGQKVGKVAGITFDDGYRNNLVNAAAILNKHNFTATTYVVSEAIGGDNFWDRKVGIPPNAIMTKSELRRWVELGLEIGCHTAVHPDLTLLGAEKIRDELVNSKSLLETILNQPVTQFCYPYGKYDEQTKEQVRDLGFKTATTMNRGRVKTNECLLELPRIPITYHTLPHLFILKLLTRYEDSRRANLAPNA
jgi:peptidoglycan/xylan/chitin deacetylase (PgdA/CDA1 family)